ncbi:TetR family transcriptional regulator [Gordonia sp. PKS22-38]|uniref:TetR family transcriptional regulator n=1 Tax=Gordonia prachuapensis TaxID=3115651 RepID=A0ABU7MYV5_9ACTN|nr:TetR family transcriptional regulator [Gordonia sp. PKS22-38]
MSERAMSASRQRTAAAIVDCAQSLAEERGLDGFTMDEVAECAGVSRRTLFNYFPGKIDAVLGSPTAPNPERLVEFRAGGPTGRLSVDIKTVITNLLDSKDADPADLDRVRRLVASDARLHKALHDKFARFAEFLADAVRAREGADFGELRARGAATATLSLFDLALEAYIESPEISLADHYVTAFDGAAALFA